MRYSARFTGRTKGAIGIFSAFSKEVEGATLKEAIENLYETHEHIQGLRMRPLGRFTREELEEPIEDEYAHLRVSLKDGYVEVQTLTRHAPPSIFSPHGSVAWELVDRYCELPDGSTFLARHVHAFAWGGWLPEELEKTYDKHNAHRRDDAY